MFPGIQISKEYRCILPGMPTDNNSESGSRNGAEVDAVGVKVVGCNFLSGIVCTRSHKLCDETPKDLVAVE